MSYLLDSDICSAHLRHHPRVTQKCLQHMGRLSISVVTLGELLTWALRRGAPVRRLQGVDDLLQVIDVLSVDETVARKYAQLRAQLLDVGRPTPE